MLFKPKKVYCLIMVFLFVMMMLPPGEVSAAAVSRTGGADRYQTAVEISKKSWDSAEMVVLARGDEYADALAGVPFASWFDAPILLTRGNALPDSTLREIERLEAGKVIILGGTSAVSAEVEKKLKQKSLVVERIGGKNRFDTAVQIAEELKMPDVVFLAYGFDFPDALAAASYAGAKGYPILLTDTEKIPSETETYLKKTGTVYVVGGEQVISENIFKHLTQDLGKVAERIAGGNRYETAVELAVQLNRYPEKMYGATGLEFPDAITGAVLAATEDAGILLVRDPVPESVKCYIQDYGVDSLSLFGQESAISKKVADSLNSIISGPPPAPGTPPVPVSDLPYANLPLHTPAVSTVTANFLRQGANDYKSATPLANLADTYMEAQGRWGVNALFLLSLSALESAWGTSALARDKNNIFGFKAYDRDPYNCASTFASKDDCINYVSGYIRLAYLNGDGVYCKGPNLVGMNCHYATDPQWHAKIARIMQSLLPYDQGGAVSKSYYRGEVTGSSVNLRRAPGAAAVVIDSISKGTKVDIEGLKRVADTSWFKVKTDLGDGWICGDYISLQSDIPGAVFFIDWYLPKYRNDTVNVRSGPGTNNQKVGTLSFGDRVKIKEIKVVKADQTWQIWHKVSYSGTTGWVHEDCLVPLW